MAFACSVASDASCLQNFLREASRNCEEQRAFPQVAQGGKLRDAHVKEARVGVREGSNGCEAHLQELSRLVASVLALEASACGRWCQTSEPICIMCALGSPFWIICGRPREEENVDLEVSNVDLRRHLRRMPWAADVARRLFVARRALRAHALGWAGNVEAETGHAVSAGKGLSRIESLWAPEM